ncbi:hypothetical protein FRC06_008660 [Ceratobasidium sp. 370]|nr:hypothetical protein FRC06_008660 [Ceratobasidium sp. 370]
MNEYTIEVLESMAKDEQASSLTKFFSPRPSTDIKATWFEATELMKSNVMQLVDEAMANMRALDELDGELSVIHKMVARADNKIERDRAETLSSLWTTLGGNKAQLAQFSSHTQLLKGLTDYREEAVEHVNGALFQLERLALDLNDLNDQAAAPLLADKAADIPLEDSSPPDFRKFVALQSQLQGAMEKSTNTLVVAINIKRSEVAVRDLIILVKESSLVGKESLARNLEEFVEDARLTGRSLQKFGGHVGGAVDETIAMNEYTIELLDRAAKDTESSLLTRFLLPHAAETRKKDIKSIWVRETRRMKSTVQQLMKEAAANTRALDRLENELNVIHTIVTRESELVAKGEEALSALWTALGGNKAQLAEFKCHNQLLGNVSKYRKAAMDHVTGALVHLDRIDSELKYLNEPVASPLILSQGEEVPLEVHVTMMRRGTGRLMEVRAREREREDEYMRRMLDSNYP